MATNGSTYGGGVSIGSTNAHIVNCTIVSNTSWVAAGINFAVSQTNTVINCVVVSNFAYHPGYRCIDNIEGYAALAFSSCANTCATPINNTAFFSLAGWGNKTNDPAFVDYAGGNYLFNRFSPCYNSGTNQPDWMNGAVDLNGHPRICHGTVDMGAYELFIPGGTMFRIR